MAFQTNVLRDGTWITENVNVHAFLSAQGSTKTEPTKRSSPTCGLLTRTIVESPVVQWIFPARLRSAEHNDVAFIGVSIIRLVVNLSSAYASKILKETMISLALLVHDIDEG